MAVGQHCADCLAQDGRQARSQVAVAEPQLHTSVTPWVTYVLIGINALVFVACVVQGGGVGQDQIFSSRIMQDGALVSGGMFDHEYWRLLTSGFLHWGVVHLAVNMLSLFLIGRSLEQFFGHARYLAVYLTALLGGSGIVMFAQRGELVVTAGASGAIYGLLGAFLVVVLMIKQSPAQVLTIIVINLVISVSIPGISLWGHIGGLIFGALATLAIYRLPVWVLKPDRRTPSAVSLVGWIGLAVLAVVAIGLGLGVGVGVSA